MSCGSCNKCNIQKCKAECCAWVPLNENFIHKHEDKLQRPIYAMNILFEGTNGNNVGQCITNPEKLTDERRKELQANGLKIEPVHEVYIDKSKQFCPFLTADCKCAVYQDRPELCKKFGSTTEDDNTFTCHYHLGKNYHFPKDGTPEKAKINDFKYFKRDVINNTKLFKEMFPSKKQREFVLQTLKKLHFI